MSESTSQRNKAIWVGSLALLTVGSVLYFTLLRKPEGKIKQQQRYYTPGWNMIYVNDNNRHVRLVLLHMNISVNGGRVGG